MVHLWDDLFLNSLNAKLIWIVKMHHVLVPLVVEIKLNFHLTNSIKSNISGPKKMSINPVDISGPEKSSVHSFSVF